MVTLFNVTVKRMLVVALVLLMGCKDSDKNSSLIFEELNESLERSNESIMVSTSSIKENLRQKTEKPETAESATKWLQKADLIHKTSDSIIQFLYGLKHEYNTKKRQVFKKQIIKDDVLNLYKKLKGYQQYILDCDPNFKTERQLGYLFRKERFENKYKTDEEFYNTFFNRLDTNSTNLILTSFQNDIFNVENRVIQYCHNQVGAMDGEGYYEKFQFVAASNSAVLKKGQVLIITAGMGEFNIKSKPSFVINGDSIPPNKYGIGEYKMKIKRKPGDYKVNVKVNYIKADGKPSTFEKDIEYTVVE